MTTLFYICLAMLLITLALIALMFLVWGAIDIAFDDPGWDWLDYIIETIVPNLAKVFFFDICFISILFVIKLFI